MTIRNPAFILALLASAAAPVSAQSPEADVRAVIDRMFDALKARDTTTMRQTFHPEFRLVITAERNGQPGHQIVPADAFIAAIGGGTEAIEERIWDVETRVHDNVATVWNQYAFYVDGGIDHCGIDAFTLVRTTDGWKVIHVADTQRREGCRDGS